MLRVGGVDGCKKGWICLYRTLPGGSIGHRCVEQIRQLLDQDLGLDLIAVDIPIGFTDKGQRECDRQARALLGEPRRRSVFPAPIRPALNASDREEASRITQQADGRRVQVQAWHITPKMLEVDQLLRQDTRLCEKIFEAHPEVCFAAWNSSAMKHSKKTKPGKLERSRLIAQTYGDSALSEVASAYRRKDVALDDIVDAFATLRTAQRLAAGQARSLPPGNISDSAGLPMHIWY